MTFQRQKKRQLEQPSSSYNMFDGHIRASTLDQSIAPGRIIPVLGSVERTQSEFDRLVASLNSAPETIISPNWWSEGEDEDI